MAIPANRRNALKSTSPQTPEGKAAVRFVPSSFMLDLDQERQRA